MTQATITVTGRAQVSRLENGMAGLREIFGEEGKANALNFALFSTSGVHGTYTTIEEIETSLLKYGPECPAPEPDDYVRPWLTVLIVQPRIVCLKYAEIDISPEDIPYLKRLRQSSWDAAMSIGR